MQGSRDGFFKNLRAEARVLGHTDSVLAELRNSCELDSLRRSVERALRGNLQSCLAEKHAFQLHGSLSDSEAMTLKFGVNSSTFVFKENLKFLCTLIGR